MISEQLDIDRLHRCVAAIQNGEYLNRAAGATTARLLMLFGDIELGDRTNIYVYVGDTRVVCDMVKRKLIDLLADSGYLITHATKDRVTVEGSTIVRFITADQFLTSYSLRGLKIARVYFDVSQHTLAQYDQEQIGYAIGCVRATGADFV